MMKEIIYVAMNFMFVNTHLTGSTRQRCLKQHVPETATYQDVVVAELMTLVKIGQEFEEGTDTRGQNFNNWGGNGGQQANQLLRIRNWFCWWIQI